MTVIVDTDRLRGHDRPDGDHDQLDRAFERHVAAGRDEGHAGCACDARAGDVTASATQLPSAMPSWRCPHCATPQPEASRCWVCHRSSTSCGTCRHFRGSVAARVGFCGLDRRRQPLAGDEVRACWEDGATPVAAGSDHAGAARPADRAGCSASRSTTRAEASTPTASDPAAAVRAAGRRRPLARSGGARTAGCGSKSRPGEPAEAGRLCAGLLRAASGRAAARSGGQVASDAGSYTVRSMSVPGVPASGPGVGACSITIESVRRRVAARLRRDRPDVEPVALDRGRRLGQRHAAVVGDRDRRRRRGRRRRRRRGRRRGRASATGTVTATGSATAPGPWRAT